jgi:hypothetical protein
VTPRNSSNGAMLEGGFSLVVLLVWVKEDGRARKTKKKYSTNLQSGWICNRKDQETLVDNLVKKLLYFPVISR